MSRAPDKPLLRCAIYTRVSTEHGLEQEFNSLHNQREAAEAYIKSQAHEGWRLLPAHFDDGGFSGGTMDRPALQRLLSEIRDRKVDVVVVYKVDRLTRSLADFAKLVELFDQHGVSFVSVTQAFNTTSSMGRLTLNVLLSFAQFEREVTGERIRDKIAASKKKGLWMGGVVPLGYRVHERALQPKPEHAHLVQSLFRRTLELGSVSALKEALDREGVRVPVRIDRAGRPSGGGPFSRGHLYKLLSNPVYVGQLTHKGRVYKGQHASIVDQASFDAVQDQLASNTHARRRERHRSEAVLTGLLRDDRGQAMSPSYAQKGGARYRYYTSQALLQGRREEAGSVARVPAPEIEKAMLGALAGLTGPNGDQGSSAEPRALVEQLVEAVTIRTGALEIRLTPEGAARSGAPMLVVPWTRPKVTRSRAVITPDNGISPPARAMASDVRRTLLVGIAKARSWMGQLANGEAADLEALAAREGRSERHVRMLLPLAGLAPDLIEAAVEGRWAEGFGVSALLPDLPMSWSEQRARIKLLPQTAP